MSYVYIRSKPELWTVGFYDPKGKWIPESDHDTPSAAAERVHYLNGGAALTRRTAAALIKRIALAVAILWMAFGLFAVIKSFSSSIPGESSPAEEHK